jgi:DNA ligase D
MASPFVEIEVDNRVVKVTNPDRVYFPASGATKRDLVDYYLAVGPGIVNALFERPTMLHRFPTGLSGEKVHQKRLPSGAPDWVETVRLHFPRWNRTADELCVTELGAVIWAVQMSTVEFHPWNSRREDPEKPDEWRIDLDPGPLSEFSQVQRVAGVVHEILDELGAVGYPKTSGGKGLHVYVRIRPDHGHKEVRRAALAFAREVDRRMPDDVTTLWWRKDRDPHDLFVDYNQNARDHTIAAAYSVRGFPDARVSTPVRWDEVDDVDPHDFTIFTVPSRFAEIGDLHEDIDDQVFDIEPLREWADRDEANGLTSTTGRGDGEEPVQEEDAGGNPSTSRRSWRSSPSTGRPRSSPGSTTTRSRWSSSQGGSSGTTTPTPTSCSW